MVMVVLLVMVEVGYWYHDSNQELRMSRNQPVCVWMRVCDCVVWMHLDIPYVAYLCPTKQAGCVLLCLCVHVWFHMDVMPFMDLYN